MRPQFRIEADGEDVTTTIADRLVSLEVVDEDGTKSDRLELSVDDRDGLVAFPDMDARLSLWLGFQGAPLFFMGSFAVDGVAGEGPAQLIEISAKPVDMKSDVRAPRTRAWEDMTLQAITAQIAAEAGLRPVVSASIAQAHWTYLAQTAESNLHFLTRIAATLDATAKPAAEALVVQKRGEGKTAGGDTIEPARIGRTELSGWRWQLDGRQVYGTIEVEWSEPGAARRNLITRGSGEPKKRLRHPFASEEEAIRAAEAELARSGRAGLKISVQVAGFRPALMAGATVDLSGLRPELNGEWHVTRVRHRLSAGLTSDFEAERKSGA